MEKTFLSWGKVRRSDPKMQTQRIQARVLATCKVPENAKTVSNFLMARTSLLLSAATNGPARCWAHMCAILAPWSGAWLWIMPQWLGVQCNTVGCHLPVAMFIKWQKSYVSLLQQLPFSTWWIVCSTEWEWQKIIYFWRSLVGEM